MKMRTNFKINMGIITNNNCLSLMSMIKINACSSKISARKIQIVLIN